MIQRNRSRRDFFSIAMAAALGGGAVTWSSAARAGASKIPLQLSPLRFAPTANGLGAVGPWGEVRVRETPAGLVPIFLQSSDKSGVIDMTKRRAVVSLGDGAITLSSAGLALGAAAAKPWDPAVVRQLVDMVARNDKLRRSLLELRAAYVTSFAVVASNRKSKPNDRAAALANKAAKAMGRAAQPGKTSCTTQTVTDTVIKEVTEQVQVWKTAEQQFDECVAAEIGKGILGGELAAMAVCALKGFVDLVVGVMTVIRSVAEEVTRTVITCVTAAGGALRDVFRGIDVSLPGPALALPQSPKPGTVIDSKAIEEARRFITAYFSGVNGFLDCLLEAKWSIAAADVALPIGAAGVEIPYGVRVCLPAACARSITFDSASRMLTDAGGTMAGLLANVVPGLGAAVTALGIPYGTMITAVMLSSLTPGGAAAVAVILLMMLLLAYYALAILAQMQFLPDSAYADGEVCIEHPTLLFALANALLTPTSLSLLFLIPPVVTG